MAESLLLDEFLPAYDHVVSVSQVFRAPPDEVLEAAAWKAKPPSTAGDRWTTLLAAFVSHEFAEAGLPAPKRAGTPKLATEWVLDTPRLSEEEIKRQTPEWLAERNIFIAQKDLVTL
jgi:hypothetical protein